MPDETPGPFQMILIYAKEHPVGASIILGSIAVFSAVSIVATLGINLEESTAAATYLIIIGVALHLIVLLFNDPRISHLLRWATVVLGMLWILVFIAHRIDSDNEKLACATYFWLPCRVTADRVAEVTAPPEAGAPPSVALSAPPTVAATSARSQVPGPPPQAAQTKVSVYFAGFERDSVKSAAQLLQTANWNMVGANRGGERTGTAAGYTEIRYPTGGNREAAQTLANALKATGLTRRNIKLVESDSVGSDEMQIWISQ